jgi:N-hydroxyarylamine O-acetyltransferase
MDQRAYLERIGYAGSLEANLANLEALAWAHLTSVPFENFDVHLGRAIKLDVDTLTTKIVKRKRGGFCYELNGLFALLLRDLGYRVDLLSARVFRHGKSGQKFDWTRPQTGWCMRWRGRTDS